jgi:RimJ/RimL family protein N-acetyltransferase
MIEQGRGFASSLFGEEKMDPRPITLQGRYVRLEPITLAHAVDLFSALRIDPTIRKWSPVVPPETLHEMESLIAADLDAQARGDSVVFAQIEQATGRAVGGTSYLRIRRRDRGLEIGATWLGKPWQRTGINTEAKYLLLRHAFADLDAVRVQFITDLRNLQSQAAIERLGAVREGILRKHTLMPDGFLRDSVLYSIVDEEWPAVNAHLEAMLAAPRGART